jgi:hypothetical protein
VLRCLACHRARSGWPKPPLRGPCIGGSPWSACGERKAARVDRWAAGARQQRRGSRCRLRRLRSAAASALSRASSPELPRPDELLILRAAPPLPAATFRQSGTSCHKRARARTRCASAWPNVRGKVACSSGLAHGPASSLTDLASLTPLGRGSERSAAVAELSPGGVTANDGSRLARLDTQSEAEARRCAAPRLARAAQARPKGRARGARCAVAVQGQAALHLASAKGLRGGSLDGEQSILQALAPCFDRCRNRAAAAECRPDASGAAGAPRHDFMLAAPTRQPRFSSVAAAAWKDLKPPVQATFRMHPGATDVGASLRTTLLASCELHQPVAPRGRPPATLCAVPLRAGAAAGA